MVACNEKARDPWLYPKGTTGWAKSLRFENSCNFESILQLCRMAFGNVTYGEQLQNNLNFEGQEYRQYKCQDFKRALLPSVPSGAWSDSLVTDVELGCQSKEELQNYAEIECGRPLRFSTFGGECPNKMGYLEIAFICDGQIHGDLFRADTQVLHDFHERQFEVLKTYIYLHNQLIKSSTEAAKEELSMLLVLTMHECDAVAWENDHVLNQTVWSSNKTDLFTGGSVSRRRIIAHAKHHLLYIGSVRSILLAHYAAGLLKGDNNNPDYEEIRCDRPNARFVKGLADLTTGTPYYSEIEPVIFEAYAEYCKNHTLGIDRKYLNFLDRIDGVEKLRGMYETIFSNGEISNKYILASNSGLVWKPMDIIMSLSCALVFVALLLKLLVTKMRIRVVP
ncbi:hypothetical protein L596_008664 [Steinernema carpocapsae]|uniref:Uncharacterized protein n=1 Tax=Steinernema carpocapsae TaxID=34508 RepID=A0A4V6A6G8_STECR|nr:hypothetical protein L596_008664 [Steinernema carpocapsae]